MGTWEDLVQVATPVSAANNMCTNMTCSQEGDWHVDQDPRCFGMWAVDMDLPCVHGSTMDLPYLEL